MDKLTARQRASIKYTKKHIKKYYLDLNDNTELELIEQMEKQANKQGYLKALIKQDLKKIKKLQNKY